jgi:hypothetical protein
MSQKEMDILLSLDLPCTCTQLHNACLEWSLILIMKVKDVGLIQGDEGFEETTLHTSFVICVMVVLKWIWACWCSSRMQVSFNRRMERLFEDNECVPGMGGVLVFGWGSVLEFEKGFCDVCGHAEVDGALAVVPLESQPAVEGAGPVCGVSVVGLDALEEMVGVFDFGVLDTEVIDDEAKMMSRVACFHNPGVWVHGE